MTQVNLGVHTHNTSVLALYRRFGFEVWGTEKGSLVVAGEPQDEHHMAVTFAIGQMSLFDCPFDKSRLDVGAIHAFLSNAYWSPGIPLQTVERAIENSLFIGGYINGLQVAFARMVTDKATFAYLADVFVIPSHRGQGLSRRLVGTLLSHPELQGLRRMLLVTRDAHGLYAKFDFSPLAAPDRFMERHNPNAYRVSGAA